MRRSKKRSKRRSPHSHSPSLGCWPDYEVTITLLCYKPYVVNCHVRYLTSSATLFGIEKEVDSGNMYIASTIFLAATSSFVSAQYIDNNTIGSCADVDCPLQNHWSTRVECTIANRTHMNVGFRTIPSRITENDADLTWTVGVQVYDFPDEAPRFRDMRREVDKTFYLGTPPSLDLTRDDLPYAGCAIVLYGNQQIASEGDSSRSCAEVIGSVCFNDLEDNARALFQKLSTQNTTSTPEEVCQQTNADLNAIFPGGCETVSGQNSWNHSEAVCESCPTRHFLSCLFLWKALTLCSTHWRKCAKSTVSKRQRELQLPSNSAKVQRADAGLWL